MIMSIKILIEYEEHDEAQKHKEYNSPPVSISSLEVSEFLVEQFRKEIISSFWSCYKNNRSGRGMEEIYSNLP